MLYINDIIFRTMDIRDIAKAIEEGRGQKCRHLHLIDNEGVFDPINIVGVRNLNNTSIYKDMPIYIPKCKLVSWHGEYEIVTMVITREPKTIYLGGPYIIFNSKKEYIRAKLQIF